MKTKAFDLKLYREALRQLSAMGLTLFALSATLSLYLILHYVDSIAPAAWAGSEALTPSELLPMGGFLTMAIAPVILCLSAFQFTAQRSSSDLYYAMPQNKLCLFTSFYGAAVTWLIVVVFGSSLLGGLCAARFSDYIWFAWGAYWEYVAMLFSVSFYIAAFFALAAAFSGSVIGTILLALLLLFVPRLTVYMLMQMIGENTGVLRLEALPWPLNLSNLFTRLWFNTSFYYGRYDVSGTEDAFSSITGTRGGAMLYTLGASVFWSVLAALNFRKRPAEAAESHIFSPWMRAAIRIGLALIPCFIPLQYLHQMKSFGASEYTLRDVLYAVFIALLIFFATEVLLTKSLRSIKKAAPSLGILAALCLLAFGGLLLGINVARSYLPAVESVSYVRLIDGYGERTEWNEKIKEIQLEDPRVIEIALSALSRRLDAFDPDYEYDYLVPQDVCCVAFKDGLQERCRIVNITHKELRELGRVLQDDENFRKACLDLPEENPGFEAHFQEKNAPSITLSEEDSLLVYRSLKQEFHEVDFDVLYQDYFFPRQVSLKGDAERAPSAGILRLVYFDDDPLGTVSVLQITANLPKTYALCLELCEKTATDSREALLSALRTLLFETEQPGAVLGMSAFDPNGFTLEYTAGIYGDLEQLGVYTTNPSDLRFDRESLQTLLTILESDKMQQIPSQDANAVFKISLTDYGLYGADGMQNAFDKTVKAAFHAKALPEELIELLNSMQE